MLVAFPFLATGLAGMAACVAVPPGGGRRAAHGVVIATALGYGALYLCYRDLNPRRLWDDYNYHYFKWLLPVFAGYTVALGMQWRRRAAWVAAVAVVAVVLPWRLAVEPGAGQAAAGAGHRLVIPGGLGVGSGLLAAAAGPLDRMSDGVHNFYVGAQWYGAAGSIAAYPVAGGLVLTPLRPIVPGAGYAELDPAISVDPAVVPRAVALRLRYGWPCFLSSSDRCRQPGLVAPPVVEPGERVAFGGASRMLGEGWSDGREGAMWTRGGHAGVRLRLARPVAGAVLRVEAEAFVPPGNAALAVSVQGGGREVAAWRFESGAPRELLAALPADVFGADGTIALDLVIANPRRPADWTGGGDVRALGLRVRSMTIGPAQ